VSVASQTRHRHVILHLSYGSSEQTLIGVAAELAHLLGFDLRGVYLEQEALPELAALPFIREYRLATREWRKLDAVQIAGEQRAAVAEARRLVDEAAAALGVVRLFEMVRGDPALLIAADSRAGDVVVVALPRLPAERLVHATAHVLEAAHRSAAAVLLVPAVLVRRNGAVAAVVCRETDPALVTAAHIAVAAGEELLLLVAGPPSLAREAVAQARSAGLGAMRIRTRGVASVTPEDILDVLGASGERLVVIGRGVCGGDDAAVASHIAASRGVPILVVEAGG
jgi:hypothetical protein